MRILRYALMGLLALAVLVMSPGSASAGAVADLAMTSPSVTMYGGDAGDNLGYSLATGDFNGDGIDDILVGARQASGPANARANAGEAYVLFGSPSLSGFRDICQPPDTCGGGSQGPGPDLTIFGAERADQLGTAVAAGDVDGDGIDDIIVSAPEADGPGTGTLCAPLGSGDRCSGGEVYVIFGSTTLGGTVDVALGQQNVTVYGTDPADVLGSSLSTLQDGVRHDIIMGAPGADGPGSTLCGGTIFDGFGDRCGAGEAYVLVHGLGGMGSGDEDGAFRGCGDGLDNGGDGLTDVADPDCFQDLWMVGVPPFTVYGADPDDELGSAVASGDLDGDGRNDLIVGVPKADGNFNAKTDAGEAWFIFGDLPAGTVRDLASGAILQVQEGFIGADPGDAFGSGVAAGDIIQHLIRRDDVVVGAPGGDGRFNNIFFAGEAWIFFNFSNVNSSNFVPKPVYGASDQKWIGEAVATGNLLGGCCAADVILGASAFGTGATYLIYAPTELTTRWDLEAGDEDLQINGAEPGDSLGFSVAAADVNGDAVHDLIISAIGAGGPDNSRAGAGEVYVIFGGDSDGDKVLNGIDNCPAVSNPDQLNTDVTENPPGDALGDLCDADDDDDGIHDEIDGRWVGFFIDDSKMDSRNFTDQGLVGGTTFGEILFRSGLDFDVTELPNPLGVRIRTFSSFLLVRFCGFGWDFISSSDVTIRSCGSAEVEVTAGQLIGHFGTIEATLPTGAIFTVDEPAAGVFDVANSAESTSSVMVGGLTLAPGETATGLTDEDGDGLVGSIDPCPANPDCDGDSLGLGDSFGLYFRDWVEVLLGTLPTVACSATPAINDEDPDALGPDWDDSQDVDGSDLFLFAERFGTELGVPPPVGKKAYLQRFDIYPTDASVNKIDGSDLFVLASYFGDSCP